MQCDNGGFCAAYNDQTVFQALAKNLDRGFTIAFQRNPGDIDVSSHVSVPTPSQPQWPSLGQFRMCTTALLRSFLR